MREKTKLSLVSLPQSFRPLSRTVTINITLLQLHIEKEIFIQWLWLEYVDELAFLIEDF